MRRSIVSAIAIGWLAGYSALAQVPSVLIREGEEAAGSGISVVNVDTPANNGVNGYGFYTTNSDNIRRIFGNPTGGARTIVFAQQNFGQYNHTAWETFWGMSDTGAISYSPTVTDTGTGSVGLDCVWKDGTKVLNQGDPIPGQAGQFSVFNSDPGVTQAGDPYWLGGFGPSGSTTNRAFFKGTSATILIKGGDVMPSLGIGLSTSASPFGNRMSPNGNNYIINHTLASPATTANDSFILVNGDAFSAGGSFVREGTAVPAGVGGVGGEAWANWDAVSINNVGDAFFTGDTSGATTTDEFVFLKSQIVLREGAALGTPIGAGTISGDIEWGEANETNDWAVTWDVTVGSTNLEALIVNGQCLLIESQLVDWNGDGVINGSDNNGKLADFTGLRAMAVGERQTIGPDSFFDVFFTADVDFNGTASTTDDLEGGFRLRVVVPEPSSLSVFAITGFAILARRCRGRRLTPPAA